MSNELRAVYTAERDAIVAVRRQHPTMGPYALARLIAGEYRRNNPDYLVAGRRPFYSILGVIRRYDKRGYYADGGEAKRAAYRRFDKATQALA